MNGDLDKLTSKLTEIVRLAPGSAQTANRGNEALIRALREAVVELNAIPNPHYSCDESMGRLVMFPIFKLLQRDLLPDTITELVLHFMTFTFTYCWNETLQAPMAKQLLDVILYLIGGPQDSKNQPSDSFLKTSNETKLAGVKALQALYLAAIRSNVKTVMTGSPLSVSYNITIFLNCIETGSHLVDLQLATIEALSTLSFLLIGSGDKISIMLPGIMSTFTKLLAEKFGKTNFKVKVSAYLFLAQLMSAIFDDEQLQADETQNRQFRTDSWLKATKEHIKQALGHISKYSNNSDKEEVSAAILSLYCGIISRCSSSLDNCLSICINGVLFYLSSDFQSISQRAEDFLATQSTVGSFKSQLESNVYDKIETLPRVLTKHEDTTALETLGSISSAISVMSAPSSSLAEALMRILGSSLQVSSSEKIITVLQRNEFKGTENLELQRVDEKPIVKFGELGLKSELTSSTQDAVSALLEKLGANTPAAIGIARELFSQITSFVGQISDSGGSSSNAVVPEFWILVAILRGVVKGRNVSQSNPDAWLQFDGQDSDQQVAASDLVLDLLEFSTDTISGANSAEYYSISNSRTVVPYLCLSIESTALLAQFLGPEFRETLVDTLYPLVSMLTHPNLQVVLSAQHAVTVIAQNCQYPNVRSLLVDNFDYLLDGISVKLNTLDITPQTPLLLSTLVSLTSSSVVGRMDDVVSSMFVLLDNYHGYTKLTESIFKVFIALINESFNAYNDKALITDGEEEKTARTYQDVHIKDLNKLIEVLNQKPDFDESSFFKESLQTDENPDLQDEQLNDYNDSGYRKDRPESENNESKPLDNPQEEEAKRWTSVVPKPTYMVLKKIVEYANTFLIHESKFLRFNLLVLICQGVPVMATSKEDFLPLVHQYWPLLIAKLQDSEPFVVVAALSCIAQTSRYSKDFITSRLVQLWDSNILRRLIPNTKLTKLPKHSNEAKVFESLANCLAVCLENSALPPDIFDGILRAMVQHLTEFPDLRKSFEAINGDALWLEEYKMERNSRLLVN